MNFWRKPHAGHSDEIFGLRLLNQLSKDLADRRTAICNRLAISDQTDEDRHLYRHVYLLLIRQFIQQMVVQYEFSASLSKEDMFSSKRKND